MGRSTTPRYVLHTRDTMPNQYCTPIIWRVRAQYGIPGDGKPTVENIDKWVTSFENSLKPGGVNAHLGIFSITEAWIVDQHNGNEVVARWVRKEVRPNEPLFQVI